MDTRTVTSNQWLALGIQWGAVTVLSFAISTVFEGRIAAQSSTKPQPAIPIRYTDVRENAKITFQQDSTQTEEKYYLETMSSW